ncbi:LEA type 2 family protein [Halorientalis salina]|uniref:LEA type 2 family protein n=1 Tax=Halorientalis salina TaxID=2932266 RepID=UPI0010ABCA99|nr:LEA type 2 family protein [Halorientalis salina]
MNRRSVLTAVGGLAVGGLAGCTDDAGAGGGDDEQPGATATATPTPMPPPIDDLEISIFDVRKPEAGLRSADMDVILEVENPTDEEIPSPSGEFDVFINGARAVTSEPTINTLEPGETARRTMTVIVDYADLGESAGDAIRDGSFTLEINGLLRAGEAERDVSLDYEYPSG